DRRGDVDGLGHLLDVRSLLEAAAGVRVDAVGALDGVGDPERDERLLALAERPLREHGVVPREELLGEGRAALGDAPELRQVIGMVVGVHGRLLRRGVPGAGRPRGRGPRGSRGQLTAPAIAGRAGRRAVRPFRLTAKVAGCYGAAVRDGLARAGRGAGRADRRAAAAIATGVLLAALTGGCAIFRPSAKPSPEARLAPEPPAPRADLDRLRSEVGELRTLIETTRRANVEHADLGVVEVRREVEAVRQALEASARNDAQRQIEALDAQARRIDLLERRASELGQMLRRLELALGSLESQLGRVLDGSSGPGRGPRRGASDQPRPE